MYWSSFMTSSMQLAKECLSQKLTDEQGEGSQPFEGLEKFAETIETGRNYCGLNQDLRLYEFMFLLYKMAVTCNTNCVTCLTIFHLLPLPVRFK